MSKPDHVNLFSHPGADVYPVRPRPEWFQTHAPPSHIGDLTATNAGRNILQVAKMEESQYDQYLACHEKWYTRVLAIEVKVHQSAVVKRALSKVKESHVQFSNADPTAQNVPPPFTARAAGVTATVVPQRKTPTPPTLSTKPHEGEKRANKVKARDARTKAKANAYQAKAEVVAESSTVAAKKQQLSAVQQIADKSALHKAELAAAKSAAARSKLIKFGSDNLEVDIDPESWKVVTKKKIWSNGVTINHHGPTHGTGSLSAVTVAAHDQQQTRTRGANFGRIAAAVDKKPQNTGASK